jgi:hypothetical protein
MPRRPAASRASNGGPRTAAVGLLLLVGAAAAAQEVAGPRSVAEHWQALTRIDVEAAYTLLEENHPGAVPEVNDKLFTSALATAHATALTRAARVKGYEGYVATLGEFAAALGDGHIASAPRFLPRTLEWSGLIAAKRGPHWVVANADPVSAGAQLSGTRIISCDGHDVSSWAREALHFRVSLTPESGQILRGGWLLVDDGNPFLQRPQACVFETAGKRTTLPLHWSTVNRDTLLHQYWKRP